MSVILTDMGMPKCCVDCEYAQCKYKEMYWYSTVDKKKSCYTSRHDDCPLKSVDGLLEEMDKKYQDTDLRDDYLYGKRHAYSVAIDTIERYCGMGGVF